MTSAGTCSSDFGRFFRSWLASPLQVAAIAPSGSALARVMTQEITPGLGPILELGPGTGAFTRALLNRGVSESDLTLVEYGVEFVAVLEARFPLARVLRMDAAQVGRQSLFDGAPVAAVVSGLPVLSMPIRKVAHILVGAFRYLRPGGAFYQFTYTPRCPVPLRLLDRLGLKATHVGRTIRNLPPAAVYRITRRQPATSLN
ncbi:methyltransferase domain-containing protein [Roseomonas hellenica]|uniref:Methyltransferase domain-containing protein n=1 Tax=Plastoroseomonas hellenica TaxID=2687306 RepID=A0ABS5F446_9PROT|nr:methyltransferase domain-containing protein [Plastoroseomonas hellenica]MBR0667349.1 methyltransferase domain-containing protein [Plastoroseomonas hellenica]